MSLLAAFPLGTAYLPGEAVILRVFEPRYLALLRDTQSASNTFVTVLIEAGSEVGGGEKRFDSGVIVAIDHVAPAEFGFQLFAHAEAPVDIVCWNDDLEYPRAETRQQPTEIASARAARQVLDDIAVDIRILVKRVAELGLSGGDFSHIDALLGLPDTDMTEADLWATFWRLASLVPCTPLDKYEFLCPGILEARGQRVRESIAHMNDLLTFRYG